MGGVIIKGIDVPKGCRSCPFNYDSCRCRITNSEIDRDFYNSMRNSDCPYSLIDDMLTEIKSLSVNIAGNDLELGNNRAIHKVIKIIRKYAGDENDKLE